MEATEVTDEEVRSLAQSILSRYGIDFTCYEPKSFRRRIVRTLSLLNLNSTFELWAKFLKERDFIYEFMNDISVGMTSMFRDPLMWKSLKHIVQKKYRYSKKIQLWHAGCSTGEEVYTMAILLKEADLISKASAIATDINKDAMREAKEGLYHKIKMVENERNYLVYNKYGNINRYYEADGKMTRMNPELIQHVRFDYQNLITEMPPMPGMFDIIFCRNVMIYFDSPAKEKILDKFYNALKPDGLLIIGFYDTMLPILKQHLFVFEDEEAKIFKKESLIVNTSMPLIDIRESLVKV